MVLLIWLKQVEEPIVATTGTRREAQPSKLVFASRATVVRHCHSAFARPSIVAALVVFRHASKGGSNVVDVVVKYGVVGSSCRVGAIVARILAAVHDKVGQKLGVEITIQWGRTHLDRKISEKRIIVQEGIYNER